MSLTGLKGVPMFTWWQSLDSVGVFNNWMQLVAMVGAALTTVSLLLLWINGSRMTRYLIEREQSASKKIKAVETAAEQIRKELLATQQNQDIAGHIGRQAVPIGIALNHAGNGVGNRLTFKSNFAGEHFV